MKKYIYDIEDINHSRKTIHFDMKGIFYLTYCKKDAGTFGPFYMCRFYQNKKGESFILHNGKRYYCDHNLIIS